MKTDACTVLPAEMDIAREWASTHLECRETPPFSFIYGGKPSKKLLASWKHRETSKKLDNRRTRHVATRIDPATGLSVRLAAVIYRDFPVVEWTVYLKNTGKIDTPIIENIQALDAELFRAEDESSPVKLHYHVGSPCKAEDYRPLMADLVAGKSMTVATSGGRPCNAHMPFFNLEAQGRGAIMALGWPGQWQAGFRRGTNGGIHATAGQERTHFTLHPGEEVRTPLIALQFHTGDRVRAQNLWRRWMIAHNSPDGKLPPPMLSGMGWFYFAPWGTSNAQTLKVFIDTYEFHKIPLDAWWIDAGWYNCDASLRATGFSVWNRTGTWEPDRRRFPNGVREVNDHAHKQGLKTILWFEPERVWHPGSWLADKHPEWLLKAAPDPAYMAVDKNTRLLDLGNPTALRWLIGHVSGLLKRERVDIYREDINMDPLSYWRANDRKDRQGITEIRHVMGHLAFWDALRRRHPNLLIDTCSSGSRRLELEGLRRAVTLWRSDYVPSTSTTEGSVAGRIDANQCMTHGICSWIPYYGNQVNVVDAYRFRSMMSPSLAFDFDPRRDDIDYDLWRRLCAQFKQVAPYFFGDYYPLTPYRLEPDAWMAWQFDCPEKGEGMVQAFRREKCAAKKVTLRLRGLQSETVYSIADIDSRETRRVSGRELMENGLQVESATMPNAIIMVYKRTRRGRRCD